MDIEQIYKIATSVTILILILFVVCHTIYRYYKWFMDFVDGKQIDNLDNSLILGVGYNVGTHPVGIAVDFIVGCILSAGAGVIWPIFWPVLIVRLIAGHIRTKRQEAKTIMNKLSGSNNY